MALPEHHVLFDPTAEPWAAFAASCTQANIFHHPAWTNLLADCYGFRPFVVAVLDSEGTVRAGLPMMETGSRLLGRRWTSLPFTDHCAPLYDDSDSLDRLARSLVAVSSDRRTPEIQLRCELPPLPDFQPYSRHVLHTAELEPNSDAVLRRIQTMHRRNVRIAERNGLRVAQGTQRSDVDAFYRLHVETRRRQGVPVQPRRFFDLLRRNLLEAGFGFVLSVYDDERCLASAIFLHWHGTLTYKFGASATGGLHLRPNDLLFWTAMRWGCENGYALLDLGRTDLENVGLRAFKGGWGAQERPLVYTSVSSAPPRSITDSLMPLVKPVIRHSPQFVCRAMGELFYRYVG